MKKIDKFMFILEYPLDWLRKITMPPCDQENFDNILFIIWPFPGILFTLWGFNLMDPTNVWIGFGIAFVLSYFFYVSMKDLQGKEVPEPGIFLYVAILGTIYGLFWTYIISTLLIDLLEVFSIVLLLDSTFMGFTVLGIGNSLPYALTTVALAKKGFA